MRLPQPYPESQQSLLAQQQQLVAGDRRAQMFPGGRGELALPKGVQRTVTASGDVFHHTPKLSAKAVHAASRQGLENKLLGLGPVTKHEAVARAMAGEIPVAVTERNAKGVEVRGATGTHATAARQVRALQRNKSPGHTVRVEDPAAVIAARGHNFGSLAPSAPEEAA